MDERTRGKLTAYQRGERRLADRELDRLFGIRTEPTERRLTLRSLLARVGPAAFEPDPTPYATIRELLLLCPPGPRDVLYDLGSGYGRVLAYGAALTRARFRGVELVAERARACERTLRRLGLDNADVRAGDATVTDFDDGTIFFLFNPFFPAALRKVGARLRALAARRPLRIASLAQSNDYFASRRWLVERTPGPSPRRYGLRLFASRPTEET